VRLAQEHGLSAPRSARMVALLDAWPQRPQRWPARQLQDSLGL
jgi:2-dehydropantoate 2-reductase